jgi:predicted ester cyclase
MSTPKLVEDSYERMWNDGNLDAAADLLTPEFSFRGSLGNEMRGREAFQNYVRTVCAALADYQCEILSCVAKGNQAFAKMCFSGRHVAAFKGYEPTGKIVQWLGAALFRFEDSMIAELWVLGDLAGLDTLLRRQAAGRTER